MGEDRTSAERHGLLVAVLVLGLVLLPACGYPSFGFVPDEAVDGDVADTTLDVAAPNADTGADAFADVAETTDVGQDAGDANEAAADTGPCPVVTGGDACTTIPKFRAAAQVVDGIGDEFCDVPATKLIAISGADMSPTPPPADIDTVMWTRIAWSTTAIHIHVRVDQATVYPPLSTEELWRGDGIELFISGLSTLAGDYTTAKQPGTFQIIAVGPQAGTAPRAGVYYGSDGLQTFLDSAHYAARITPTGYELEMKIDWADLKATPSSGKVIGFDIGVDVRQTASASLRLQSFLGFVPVSVTTPCALPRGPHPSCDDRTWCTPTLE